MVGQESRDLVDELDALQADKVDGEISEEEFKAARVQTILSR